MGSGLSPTVLPLLTFVVPTYRVEPYIRRCFESILAETEVDLEVVAVDDGSPDGCGDILDSYAAVDPRMRVRHLSSNTGLGQARNTGLEAATGAYVWFVDGDDWLPPGSVAAVAARLRVHDPDVLIVDHAEVFDDGRVGASRPAGLLRGLSGPLSLDQHPQLLRYAQSACTKIVRRAFLDEIKLRFAPGWYEDSSFSHPLLMAAERIDVLDRVCYHYRQRERGITRTVDARHFEIFDQYRRLFERVDEDYPRADRFRPELFRLMIDHYLVVVGNEQRVPPGMRREFFRKVAAEFRSRQPLGGYDKPSGLMRLKHFLVRHNAYALYATLRHAYRPLRHLRQRRRAAGSARLG